MWHLPVAGDGPGQPGLVPDLDVGGPAYGRGGWNLMILGGPSNPSHYYHSMILWWHWEDLELQDDSSVREFEAGRVGNRRRVLAELLKVKTVRSGTAKVTQARTEVHLLVWTFIKGGIGICIHHPQHSNSEWDSLLSSSFCSLIADVDILWREILVPWRHFICSRIQMSLCGTSSMRAVCTGWKDTRMLSLKSFSWRRRTCWSPGKSGWVWQ